MSTCFALDASQCRLQSTVISQVNGEHTQLRVQSPKHDLSVAVIVLARRLSPLRSYACRLLAAKVVVSIDPFDSAVQRRPKQNALPSTRSLFIRKVLKSTYTQQSFCSQQIVPSHTLQIVHEVYHRYLSSVFIVKVILCPGDTIELRICLGGCQLRLQASHLQSPKSAYTR